MQKVRSFSCILENFELNDAARNLKLSFTHRIVLFETFQVISQSGNNVISSKRIKSNGNSVFQPLLSPVLDTQN